MTALKAHEVDAFLKKRGEFPFTLVYGPDRGLVNERCALLAKKAGADEASLVRLEGERIAADPALLDDEARAISLFGGPRVIWLRVDGKAVEEPLENLLSDPPRDVTLIVEAGDLKPSSALRKLFEKEKIAIALPCYSDDARALGQLINDELAQANISIEPDAKHALIENLGGDRLATRQELQKLCLYALQAGNITLADIFEVSGDVSALALDGILDQLGIGETSHALSETGRHLAEGTHASVLLTTALRHMLMLQALRYDVDEGRTTSDAIRSASPPIFFKRQPLIERQLVLWSLPKIEHALNLLYEAVLKTRQLPQIANALCERAILDVALLAKGR